MTSTIDALYPRVRSDVDDAWLLADYQPPADSTWLRMNFVSALDGAVALEGVSGGLGGEADHRVFDLLRYSADVVLVGAGTVRDEGYGPMVLDDAATAWRTAHGLAAQPVFALVSGRAELDPDSEVFTGAPVRPIVYTAASAPEGRRRALAGVADVVVTGQEHTDPRAIRADLESRGLRRIHGEGGPSLFGSFLEAGVVDELCLTLAPALVGGGSGRISRSEHEAPTGMELASILRSGSELLLRYRTAG